MKEIITFVLGAIIFFSVGTIFAFLDELFQAEFGVGDAEQRVGRGFWVTVALVTIAIALILLVYYLFVDKEDGTTAEKQFINIHSHRTKDTEPSSDVIRTGEINVGV